MMIFVDLALKTTLLIAVAALCSLALHRASAAARHLLWTMAMAGCLLLPVLTTVLPDWRVAALPDLRLVVPGEPVEEVVSGEGAESIVSPATGRAAETVEPSESRPGYRDGTDAVSVRAAPPWYVWAWGGGGLLVLLVFAASARQLHLAVRRYRELDDPGWREDAEKIAGRAGLSETSIRLLRSSNLIAPMTWGVWRPVIVLPRDCIDWSREQRHEVLLHEIAHVRRRDCLTQWLANLACVIYWCHPLMWWASRRMLTERERACDDQVIQGGAKPADYAKNLIEIARTLGGGRPMLPAGVAMARRSQVSGRLLAVLDPGCNRGRPRRTHVLMAAVAVLAVLSPLAALTPGRAVQAAPVGIYAEDGDPAGDDGRRTSPPPAARWSDSEIRQAIAGANRAIEEAVSDRDGGAAARLYSPDAILYGMGGIERHGRRQVAELYESLFAQGYRELTIAVHEMLRLDDDLVHESGEFTYYHENGVTRLRGRYMSIWRYEDGEWFVYRDLSNI